MAEKSEKQIEFETRLLRHLPQYEQCRRAIETTGHLYSMPCLFVRFTLAELHKYKLEIKVLKENLHAKVPELAETMRFAYRTLLSRDLAVKVAELEAEMSEPFRTPATHHRIVITAVIKPPMAFTPQYAWQTMVPQVLEKREVTTPLFSDEWWAARTTYTNRWMSLDGEEFTMVRRPTCTFNFVYYNRYSRW